MRNKIPKSLLLIGVSSWIAACALAISSGRDRNPHSSKIKDTSAWVLTATYSIFLFLSGLLSAPEDPAEERPLLADHAQDEAEPENDSYCQPRKILRDSCYGLLGVAALTSVWGGTLFLEASGKVLTTDLDTAPPKDNSGRPGLTPHESFALAIAFGLGLTGFGACGSAHIGAEIRTRMRRAPAHRLIAAPHLEPTPGDTLTTPNQGQARPFGPILVSQPGQAFALAVPAQRSDLQLS